LVFPWAAIKNGASNRSFSANTRGAAMFRSRRKRSDIRDMPQGIDIEDFSHLEMVGKNYCSTQREIDQASVHDAPLFKLKRRRPTLLA
jgi:Mn-containing catalase